MKQVANHAVRPVKNTELCNYNAPSYNCYSLNTCSQTHIQIKHFLAHLQDLIPTLAGRRYISINNSQSKD